MTIIIKPVVTAVTPRNERNGSISRVAARRCPGNWLLPLLRPLPSQRHLTGGGGASRSLFRRIASVAPRLRRRAYPTRVKVLAVPSGVCLLSPRSDFCDFCAGDCCCWFFFIIFISVQCSTRLCHDGEAEVGGIPKVGRIHKTHPFLIGWKKKIEFLRIVDTVLFEFGAGARARVTPPPANTIFFLSLLQNTAAACFHWRRGGEKLSSDRSRLGLFRRARG